MRKIQDYLELPWSIDVEKRHDDGAYFVARVKELPGLVATGSTEEELDSALWEAVEDHLRSYLEDGEEPPLPAGSEAVFEREETLDRLAKSAIPYRLNEEVSASTLATQEKDAKDGVLRDRDRDLEPMAG